MEEQTAVVEPEVSLEQVMAERQPQKALPNRKMRRQAEGKEKKADGKARAKANERKMREQRK